MTETGKMISCISSSRSLLTVLSFVDTPERQILDIHSGYLRRDFGNQRNVKGDLSQLKEQRKEMKHFLGFYIFTLVLLNCFFSTTGFDDATAPGDIIIGGIFPIHESVNVTMREDGSDSRICNR